MGVSVMDELDFGPGPPLELVLPLIVGVILLRVRSGEVSLLLIEGVGVTKGWEMATNRGRRGKSDDPETE